VRVVPDLLGRVAEESIRMLGSGSRTTGAGGVNTGTSSEAGIKVRADGSRLTADVSSCERTGITQAIAARK
jgi:hypothetical protein